MMNFGIKTKAPAKSKNRVGLDIGAHSVKIVEISDAPDRPALLRLGEKKIIGLSGEETSASIKALAEEAKISAKEACVSVSGPSIIVRFITMPKMSGEELAGAIRFEAEKFIPFNINDCVLDFQILKKAESPGPARDPSRAKPRDESATPVGAAPSAAKGQMPAERQGPFAKTMDESDARMDILLAAARKEEIGARIALAERAGFLVNAVDVDTFALTNSFLKNFTKLKPEKAVALLNIGALSTNLSIVSGNAIAFVRETAVGGNDFTDSISMLGTLFDDIKLSFSYHENQSGRSVEEIYISGGGSKLAGLEDAFTEAFGSSPNRWNPFGFLDISQARIGPDAIEKMKDSFAVAVGLALKAVYSATQR